MNFYLVSIFSRPLEHFSYQSQDEYSPRDIVKVKLNGRTCTGIIVEKTQKPEFKCLNIEEKLGFLSKSQFELARFISEYYVCSLGEACALFSTFLTNKKLSYQNFVSKKDLLLSSKQEQIRSKLQNTKNALLFGDTGSGKTELYISLMQEALQNGNNVIFLMPEISLTPQTKKRLVSYFGDMVAIWHSKITKKKKQEILQGLHDGSVRIIAGARSALFLPVSNLSLIIVDEEHDESYKSNSNPRYNARDLSLMYGKICDAKVVLGSATPSLVSYEKLPTFRLKGTYFQSKKNYIYENAHNEMTPLLLSHIKKALHQGSQVIVFVPTRANFKYLTCKECGENVKCPYCDVGMSLHSHKRLVKCHYCNLALKIPSECSHCKAKLLEANRIGTAEVAKNLSEVFEDKCIKVFDRDEVKTHSELKKILKEFNDEKIDILVGTQMLSKGHDYHGVGLSVVLGLDSLLANPDYRAREKALSLCLQVAGRAGRKGQGEVFIQSQNAEFFSSFVGDYEEFLKEELGYRKGLYPPYVRLLKLQISHRQESICKSITDDLVALIKSLPLDVELVGYGASSINKIASKYRYEILLRSNSAKTLLQTAHKCKRPYVQIDMDPLSFS